MGHRAAPGRRFPGPGGRRHRQRAGRAADRAQARPRTAGKIRHAGRRARSTSTKCPARPGRRTSERIREQALLSRQLVRLDATCRWRSTGRSARPDGADPARGARRCSRSSASAGWPRSSTALPGGSVRGPARRRGGASPYTARSIRPRPSRRSWRELRQQKRISVDTETTHIWPRWAEIVGLSFAWNDRRGLVSAAACARPGERTLDPQATLATLCGRCWKTRPSRRSART